MAFASSCGSPAHDAKAGRLSWGGVVEFEQGGSAYQTCYFDAEVTLARDGHVAEVVKVGEAAKGKVEAGLEVDGAATAFPDGVSVPVPIHIDDEGMLLPSYAFCEEIAEQ